MVKVSLDVLLPLSSLIVALLALLFTIWQFAVQRKHNRISCKPHLTKFSKLSKMDNTACLEVLLINNGLGPAFIDNFQVFYQGELCVPEEAIETALGPFISNYSFTTLGDDYAIADKETVTLLWVKFPFRTKEDIKEVTNKIDEFGILVEYSSAYEKMPHLTSSPEAQSKG